MPRQLLLLPTLAILTGLLCLLGAPPAFAPTDGELSWDPGATFSVLGHDPQTDEVGGAVQSRVFRVGNGMLWAEADVGVVATQAVVKREVTLKRESESRRARGEGRTGGEKRTQLVFQALDSNLVDDTFPAATGRDVPRRRTISRDQAPWCCVPFFRRCFASSDRRWYCRRLMKPPPRQSDSPWTVSERQPRPRQSGQSV